MVQDRSINRKVTVLYPSVQEWAHYGASVYKLPANILLPVALPMGAAIGAAWLAGTRRKRFPLAFGGSLLIQEVARVLKTRHRNHQTLHRYSYLKAVRELVPKCLKTSAAFCLFQRRCLPKPFRENSPYTVGHTAYGFQEGAGHHWAGELSSLPGRCSSLDLAVDGSSACTTP